jgi:hypothetical protein
MGIGEDETMTHQCATCAGKLIVRAFGCPDGVWVVAASQSPLRAFVAKYKPAHGKHGDRTLRLDGRCLQSRSWISAPNGRPSRAGMLGREGWGEGRTQS